MSSVKKKLKLFFSEMFHQHFQKPFMLEINQAGQEASFRLIEGRVEELNDLILVTGLFVLFWIFYLLIVLEFFLKKVKVIFNLYQVEMVNRFVCHHPLKELMKSEVIVEYILKRG